MRVVRLCKRAYLPLDGIGASITGGRWNSPGKRVVYTASCGALASLEYLVHVGAHLPVGLLLVKIEIPDGLAIETTDDWAPADLGASRRIGDDWIDSNESAVLEVPSVLIPRQKNFLLNPLHPMFVDIKIAHRSPFAFDTRLLSLVSSGL
jgi:RES domain-containing protein